MFAAQLQGCRSKRLEQLVTMSLERHRMSWPFAIEFLERGECVEGVVRGLSVGRERERQRLRQFDLAGLRNVLCCVSEGCGSSVSSLEKWKERLPWFRKKNSQLCWPKVLIKSDLSVLCAFLCWSSASASIWSALCVRFELLRTVLAAVMVPVYACGKRFNCSRFTRGSCPAKLVTAGVAGRVVALAQFSINGTRDIHTTRLLGPCRCSTA